MLTKREYILGSAATLALLPAWRASAEGNELQVLVPAAPNGGWDQTAGAMEQALRAERLAPSMQVTYVPGSGGTIGLAQFVSEWSGRPNALMVGGMTMVGALIVNKPAVNLTQTVPIARLTSELEVLVVPGNSPIKSVKDFAAALKKDPKKVPVVGGSVGGTGHILLGLIAKTLGIPATELNYRGYSSGAQALVPLSLREAVAGISGLGEFGEQIKLGKLRAIGIAGHVRHPGAPDLPTLKEQGVDAEVSNWRGIFAPPNTTPQHRQALIAMVEKMAGSEPWKMQCTNRDWTPTLVTGDAYAKFISDETTRIGAILKDLGLV
jgi:putative tricarboxylic transport membrane protein